MPMTTIAGHDVHVDDEGFLTRTTSGTRPWRSRWPRRSASSSPTSTWRSIRFLRADFTDAGRDADAAPRVHRRGVPTKRLFELFPKKPAKKMAYVAGLPKPHGCV